MDDVSEMMSERDHLARELDVIEEVEKQIRREIGALEQRIAKAQRKVAHA